jgi:hypothetical protein
MTGLLSPKLFREVRPEFFRVLSGPAARLYVDVLDALEREATQRSQGLPREEALGIVERSLELHGNVELDEDGAPAAMPIREKARVVLDNLRRAGWLDEEQRSDWQRLVHFEPNGILLLQTLRKMAFPEAAIFSDKLVTVCTTLIGSDAMQEQPWAQVESCIANLEAGLTELRAVEKSIERQTRRQLSSSTLKENLSRLFDEFAVQIGRACYAELVRARLPTRLAEARQAVEEFHFNEALCSKMEAEVQRREPALATEAACTRVRTRLEELAELLDQVVPLAEAVDRRTAEFTRRSLARFRYLQEVTGENRSRVQTFFETLNREFAGQRVSELDAVELNVPSLRLHDAQLLAGLESLYTPRLRRSAAEIPPLDEDASEQQQDRALRQLGVAMRDSMTVARANRFVASLPAELGDRISSEDLPVRNEEDLADLIACLLHASSTEATFRIEVPRRAEDTDAPEFHRFGRLGYRVERFTLARTAK